MNASVTNIAKVAKQTPEEVQAEIADVMERARRAQRVVENYTQEQADAWSRRSAGMSSRTGRRWRGWPSTRAVSAATRTRSRNSRTGSWERWPT